MVALSRRPSRSALAALAVGLGLAFAAAEMAPLPGPPLYDGVVPVEAYRWLVPPPGEHGGAQGASTTLSVSGGSSPLVSLATPEEGTPQAQIFAAPGDLTLPPGTTSITVSITPIQPESLPTEGHIAGNVYRITIVNQAGVAASAAASGSVSIVLRAPDQTTSEATVSLFKSGTWQPLKTDAAGLGATFLAVVTEFGDFALTLPGPAGTPGGSVPPSGPLASGAPSPVPSSAGGPGTDAGIPQVTIFAGVAIALVLAGLLATAFLPRRRPRGAAGRPPPRTRR